VRIGSEHKTVRLFRTDVDTKQSIARCLEPLVHRLHVECVDVVPFLDQRLREVPADEATSTGNEYAH
jgi:hypothetical protein